METIVKILIINDETRSNALRLIPNIFGWNKWLTKTLALFYHIIIKLCFAYRGRKLNQTDIQLHMCSEFFTEINIQTKI